eukprot:jgi/Bigna1/73534/fgenesh1_pg.24_\
MFVAEARHFCPATMVSKKNFETNYKVCSSRTRQTTRKRKTSSGEDKELLIALMAANSLELLLKKEIIDAGSQGLQRTIRASCIPPAILEDLVVGMYFERHAISSRKLRLLVEKLEEDMPPITGWIQTYIEMLKRRLHDEDNNASEASAPLSSGKESKQMSAEKKKDQRTMPLGHASIQSPSSSSHQGSSTASSSSSSSSYSYTFDLDISSPFPLLPSTHMEEYGIRSDTSNMIRRRKRKNSKIYRHPPDLYEIDEELLASLFAPSERTSLSSPMSRRERMWNQQPKRKRSSEKKKRGRKTTTATIQDHRRRDFIVGLGLDDSVSPLTDVARGITGGGHSNKKQIINLATSAKSNSTSMNVDETGEGQKGIAHQMLPPSTSPEYSSRNKMGGGSPQPRKELQNSKSSRKCGLKDSGSEDGEGKTRRGRIDVAAQALDQKSTEVVDKLASLVMMKGISGPHSSSQFIPHALFQEATSSAGSSTASGGSIDYGARYPQLREFCSLVDNILESRQKQTFTAACKRLGKACFGCNDECLLLLVKVMVTEALSMARTADIVTHILMPRLIRLSRAISRVFFTALLHILKMHPKIIVEDCILALMCPDLMATTHDDNLDYGNAKRDGQEQGASGHHSDDAGANMTSQYYLLNSFHSDVVKRLLPKMAALQQLYSMSQRYMMIVMDGNGVDVGGGVTEECGGPCVDSAGLSYKTEDLPIGCKWMLSADFVDISEHHKFYEENTAEQVDKSGLILRLYRRNQAWF